VSVEGAPVVGRVDVVDAEGFWGTGIPIGGREEREVKNRRSDWFKLSTSCLTEKTLNANHCKENLCP
jgi:hypothetical protein